MYKRELQQTARKSLFLKLLHLPYGILIPILISTEVTNRACGEDEERSDDGSRHSGNRVLLYLFLRQTGNRVPKRKGAGGSGVQNETVSDDFFRFL